MIFPSLATGDGTYERPKFGGDMHFSARQSKATNPPTHDEASRSFTRPVSSKHPLSHPLPGQGLLSSQEGLLQRKCACGGTPGIDGECAECRKSRPQRGSF